MSDLIDRQDAIYALGKAPQVWRGDDLYAVGVRKQYNRDRLAIENMPSARIENQVHLCDSCRHVYPECPGGKDDVIFGNGKGNDNICACNQYEPSAQPEIVRCKDCKHYGDDHFCCYPWRTTPEEFCSRGERRE